MKKSYKLLGQMWDNMPTMNVKKREHIDKIELSPYTFDYSLFDIDNYVRYIAVSELFSKENLDEINSILDTVKYCNEIYIFLDFKPNTTSPVIMSFYSKRVVQLWKYCDNYLKRYGVVVMVFNPDGVVA